jgi:hypothetical protein
VSLFWFNHPNFTGWRVGLQIYEVLHYVIVFMSCYFMSIMSEHSFIHPQSFFLPHTHTHTHTYASFTYIRKYHEQIYRNRNVSASVTSRFPTPQLEYKYQHMFTTMTLNCLCSNFYVPEWQNQLSYKCTNAISKGTVKASRVMECWSDLVLLEKLSYQNTLCLGYHYFILWHVPWENRQAYIYRIARSS